MAHSSMVLLKQEGEEEGTEATTSSAPQSTAEKCAVCLLHVHKYKCPRCATKTCSLDCCKRHKTDANCSGQRDKTKFVDKGAFDEMTLLSDYRFLEEQARLVDAAQRDPLVAAAPAADHSSHQQVSAFCDNLRKFVHSAFGIDLKFMPAESTRHKQNKTRFNRNATLVIWSLELVFDLGSLGAPRPANLVKVHTKTNLFHSNETLRALLVRFHRLYSKSLFQLTADRSAKASAGSQLTESESQSVLLVLDAFKANFHEQPDSTDVQGLNVLIEETSPGRRMYLKLDLDQRLDQALQGRTIIEYPTLFVVKDADLDRYPQVTDACTIPKPSGQKRGPSPVDESAADHHQGSSKHLKPADPVPAERPQESKAPVIQRLVSEDYELEEGELD